MEPLTEQQLERPTGNDDHNEDVETNDYPQCQNPYSYRYCLDRNNSSS